MQGYKPSAVIQTFLLTTSALLALVSVVLPPASAVTMVGSLLGMGLPNL